MTKKNTKKFTNKYKRRNINHYVKGKYNFLKNKIITILLFLISINNYGQVDTSIDKSKIFSEIKEYIQKIDANVSLVEMISEGTIEYKGGIGGFSTYYLFDSSTKTLYRTRHSETTDINLDITFYYKNNQVVYIKAKKGYWENKYHEIFEQEIYFYKGQVIYEKGNGMKPSDLHSIGLYHLQSYIEILNAIKWKD